MLTIIYGKYTIGIVAFFLLVFGGVVAETWLAR